MESIKSSKFESFKTNQLLDAINVIGGKLWMTRANGSSSYNDCWDDSTGKDIHCADNSTYDSCPSQIVTNTEVDQNNNQYDLICDWNSPC